MNTPNYAEMLPNSECSPQDAIESLIEKVPRYINEGLFKVPDFVQVFAESVTNIMNNLPENLNERKPVEIELAYMVHNLYINHDIVIARDDRDLQLRDIELSLEREGVLSDYLSFAYENSESMDTSNIVLGVSFLQYLALYCVNGVKDTTLFLKTCVRLSQLEGGINILMTYLYGEFFLIPSEEIQSLLEKNDEYLGSKNDDNRIYDSGTTKSIPDDTFYYGISRNQKEVIASFHFFLEQMYDTYIQPKLDTLSKQEKHEFFSILNNFRDIVDPKGYVPVYYFNENAVEFIQKITSTSNERVLH